MRGRRTRWLAIGVILLVPPKLCGQESASASGSPRLRAAQEIERVLADAYSIKDKAAFVKVRAKAASVLWPQDRARAQKLFQDLWSWIDAQDDASLDREEARTHLLKILFPRDAKLATKLLRTLQEGESGGEAPRREQSKGTGANLQRLEELSAELIESDPATAAGLLSQSLNANPDPSNIALLERLRKTDVGLANRIAIQALVALRQQPAAQSLTAAYSFIEYITLTAPARAANPSGQTDEAVRRQFFHTSYEILSQALQESGPPSASARIRRGDGAAFSLFTQTQLAAVLAALAEGYAPERAVELNELARKMSADTAPQLQELTRYTLERINGRRYRPKDDTPEATLSMALTDGDFSEARRLLDKVEKEDLRKFYAYEIAVGEFKADMSRSDFSGALIVAREIEDAPTRAYMVAQLAKAADAKGDSQTSRQALAEARAVLSKAECNGKKVVALFSLATAAAPTSFGDAIELLNGGTACINSLSRSAPEAEKNAAVVEPGAFIESRELRQAFLTLGRIDLDNALLSAVRIEDKPTELVARLSACEMWLKSPGEKGRAAPTKAK
jgi:hypothetical protein